MTRSSSAVIVGIGNSVCKDDGVGLSVARAVRNLALGSVTVIEGISDGYSLIDIWHGFRKAIVIDCVVSGGVAGQIFRFDALNDDIPAGLFDGHSTHSISAIKAIALGRTLGRLPRSLILYGIEGKDFTAGESLTPEVAEAARQVAQQIVQELSGKLDAMDEV